MNKRQTLYVLDTVFDNLQNDDINSARITLFSLGQIIGDEIIAENEPIDLTDEEMAEVSKLMVEKLESIRSGGKDVFGSHSKN